MHVGYRPTTVPGPRMVHPRSRQQPWRVAVGRVLWFRLPRPRELRWCSRNPPGAHRRLVRHQECRGVDSTPAVGGHACCVRRLCPCTATCVCVSWWRRMRRLTRCHGMCSFIGPRIASSLREQSMVEAIDDLSTKVSDESFEAAFGASKDELPLLVEHKTVSINRLMELVRWFGCAWCLVVLARPIERPVAV